MLDVGELVATITVDDEGLDKGLDEGEARFRRFGADADKVTDQVADKYGRTADNKKVKSDLTEGRTLFQQFGKVATGVAGMIGAAFAAIQITGLLKTAIAEASDLSETTSKVERIFGDASGAIKTFAQTADTGLGQSQQSALDAAATFAIFGKGAGLTGARLSDFSTDLVTLAGDLASFSNTTPQEAIEALGAALRGEAEPIQRYGVLLNEQVLKAAAVSHGIVQATKDANDIKAANIGVIEAQQKLNESMRKNGPAAIETQKAQLGLVNAQNKLKDATAGSVPDLSKQQQVLAAQAAIIDQTSDAQGDFSRTSNGLANQQRILNAEWDNAKAALGNSLLPVAVQFANILTSITAGLKENQSWLLPLIVALGTLAVAIWLIKSAVEAWAVVQWLLDAAMDANPIGLLLLGIALLVAGILLLWNNSAGFRDFFIGVWQSIWGFLKGVGHWFAGPFVNFFKSVGHVISDIFKIAVNNIVDLLNTPLNFANRFVIGNLNKMPGVHLGMLPLIPRLAQGGIVPVTPGGRLVVAGDGDEPEGIIPLSKLRAMTGAGGSGGTLNIVIHGTGILRGIRQKTRAGGGRTDTVLVGG